MNEADYWKRIVENDRKGYRENITQLRKEILQLKHENRKVGEYEDALVEIVEATDKYYLNEFPNKVIEIALKALKN